MLKLSQFALVVLFTFSLVVEVSSGAEPYQQDLPQCTQGFERVAKVTKKKAILCPMIRDEEGFLSEWVGYYQMQGFDHIMIFNDSSTDQGHLELRPFIDSGFVSVRSNWSTDSLEISPNFLRNEFKKAMAIKAALERECKLQAVEWGYDFFMSLDLDEYVIPPPWPQKDDQKKSSLISVVDWLDFAFNKSEGRSIHCISKFNFPSVPHLLEPVNLLTMEAYQTRMNRKGKMNYYTSVMPKCAFQLRGHPAYATNVTSEFIATCCHFHGCQGHDFRHMSRFCRDNYKEQFNILHKGRNIREEMVINHYSRSLEKFTLKRKTWGTASGEAVGGQDSKAAATDYSMAKFFQRSVGWKHDNSSLRYTCQLREHLAKVTGTPVYHRPGSQWFRNPEFGKYLSVPEKRGRFGRPNPEGFHFRDGNPYHYKGYDDVDWNTKTVDEGGQ